MLSRPAGMAKSTGKSIFTNVATATADPNSQRVDGLAQNNNLTFSD